jgi:hypothetical protein
MSSCRIRVIDLDDASTRIITWEPDTPDHLFESVVESQIREKFEVSEEAWVDLMSLTNNSILTVNKETLSSLDVACLCLSPKTEALVPMKCSELFEIRFHDRFLGMTIRENNQRASVHQFKRSSDGAIGPAEASGKISVDDIIYKVQGSRTAGRSYAKVVQMLQTTSRPLSIQFFRPLPRDGLYAVEFRERNMNMIISMVESQIIVTELPLSKQHNVGFAQRHGVRMRDIIHAIDGKIVRKMSFEQSISMLSSDKRPIIVVFARSLFQNPEMELSIPSERFSFASTALPSPRDDSKSESEHRSSSCSAISSIVESMLVEDMLAYCESLRISGVITSKEAAILREMVGSMRPDLCCAIRRKNRNGIIAIVRSPNMRVWDHLLQTKESILLAGPVSMSRKKRYHLLLTDHERLLFVNRESNELEDEIMCSHIVTVSSNSNTGVINILTSKQEYNLQDNFIGAIIWVRAILPFTCTQGYLKVASSHFFLGTKKRYFILRGNKLSGFKKESMMHTVGAKSSSIMLDGATIDVIDPKSQTFAIITPDFEKAGKKLVLTATSVREYNKWISAFHALKKISGYEVI